MPKHRAKKRSANPVARLLNPEEGTARSKMKRPPATMNNAVGAEIGKVLELSLPDLEVKFTKSKPALIWFPKQKALGFFMWVPGEKTHAKPDWLKVRPSARQFENLEEVADVAPAVRAFEAFHGRNADDEARTYEFPFRSTRGWYSINRVVRIDYWSDKFRASREYTHRHGAGVRLYIYGSPRKEGPSFWLIRGGALTVTQRGIIN